jgi:RNA polymerase sigma factor (sigma-70 family)
VARKNKILTHAELDAWLDRAAQDLDRYDQVLSDLIADCDRKRLPLEIADPSSWRRASAHSEGSSLPSLEDQFRQEVDAILILDREPEARLARRIEFARHRAQKAMAEEGLDPTVLEGGRAPTEGFADGGEECAFSARVCRRWQELHALRTEMVERNLYLVLINVERYSHTRGNRLDLIQEGAASLFRAVDGFDWRRGLLFRTYAVHWLNQAFRSHLYNFGNTVRVPVYLQKAMKHVQDAIVRLGDPNASVEAIAAQAGLAESLVAAALAASRSTHSIDLALGEDGEGSSLRDIIGLEDSGGSYDPAMEEFTIQNGVDMALDRLSDRERFVVTRRFGIGMEREHTLAEIARELGVSLERIRQIQVRAMAKMATPHLRKAVDPFLF